MAPVAVVVTQGNRMAATPVIPAAAPVITPPSDAYAKDAVIAWFRGEFAAANAIIDALCDHLAQIEGEAAMYDSLFAAIHRRRVNWIPILQMQNYYSIGDVMLALNKVADKKKEERNSAVIKASIGGPPATLSEEKSKEKTPDSDVADDDLKSEITEAGSPKMHALKEHIEICSKHEDCEARCALIQIKKGFMAREPVRGHMVNVLRGLKVFEGVFTDVELAKLRDFAHEIRIAGQNGELSGETFTMYNQQMKGNKRELIQFGIPIFGKVQDGEIIQTGYIEPIPTLLQSVIHHLIQWRLIPEKRRPNSCIINFFDPGEYSQPFLKPPHLDQPLSTLILSESTMAFGRVIVSDGEGNYTGTLMLPLKEGSLIVMRGNSCDTARHAMCASSNKRVTITFFKVRTDTMSQPSDPMALTIWQPSISTSYAIPSGYAVTPLVMSPQGIANGGTGVFLPWAMGSHKHTKHLPPRAQRAHLLALSSPASTRKPDSASKSGINVS